MLTHKGSLNFRPEIHGLRAIAVILVIVFHLNPSWMPFGYVGVDIFFVISGFLITRIILKQIEAGTFTFFEFFTRRIKRIFPALFVVLIVSLIVAILVLSSLEYKEFCRSLRYASFQGGNFFFERNSGYFDLSSKYQVLLHTWSLGVEEQFYLAWPILLLIIHRLKYPKILPMLIVIPASLAGMVYFNSIESLKGFYMFYCRAWEFSLGALLATNKIKPLKSPLANEVLAFLGLSLVACSLFLGSVQHSHETLFLFLSRSLPFIITSENST